MIDATSLSEQFAHYACSLSFADLSPSQIQRIKIHFLDWLGSAIAGQTQTPVQIILETAGKMGGHPESTIVPNGTRTTSLLAAWANSASSCLLEMDDLHRESVFHPASVVIPAALAMAERKHASGRDFITAIVAGYEVGIRVALGVGLSHYRYWHTTATCGTFAAAAGAVRVLGGDEKCFVWALGSAGTQAAGLWEFLNESAMSKPLHIGKAAMNGVLAALLAEKGLTGARKILEGEKGFFRATSQDFDEKKALESLGRKSLWEQTSLKFYSSCGHTHPAIDAVLQASGGRSMKAEEIERVEVSIYQAALDLLGKVEPVTSTQAKFHLPFCVATALRYGNVEFKDFHLERLMNPEIQQLMRKVVVRADPGLDQVYPRKWASRAVIFMPNGQRFEGACESPKGDPENPITEAEIINKFKTLTQDNVPSETAEKILQRIMILDQMMDVADLLHV
jgi:2-methylcitrate dehydratase PrpD